VAKVIASLFQLLSLVREGGTSLKVVDTRVIRPARCIECYRQCVACVVVGRGDSKAINFHWKSVVNSSGSPSLVVAPDLSVVENSSRRGYSTVGGVDERPWLVRRQIGL
jgi:hypothetical protein